MLASFLGDMVETVYHVAVVDPGVYQDRAGLLFGPFSPIYGFGATLMTIALNRFHNAHIIVVFLVSAVIGGAFEYFVSWFLTTRARSFPSAGAPTSCSCASGASWACCG